MLACAVVLCYCGARLCALGDNQAALGQSSGRVQETALSYLHPIRTRILMPSCPFLMSQRSPSLVDMAAQQAAQQRSAVALRTNSLRIEYINVKGSIHQFSGKLLVRGICVPS